MKKRKGTEKSVIIFAVIVIFFVMAFAVRCSLAPSSSVKADKFSGDEINEGVEKIRTLADRDITQLKNKIKVIEKFERLEQIEAGNFGVIFDDSVIMGDSHAEGIAAYGLLDSSRVAAVKGKNLRNCDDSVQQAVSLNPSKVFMNYGMNDIGHYRGNTDKFTAKYKEVIDKVKASLPDADIYVCSVFPVQQEALARQPYLAEAGNYNAALKAMCENEGLVFIDTTPLIRDEHYEPDHIHTNKAFHKIWLKELASKSGLLDVWS